MYAKGAKEGTADPGQSSKGTGSGGGGASLGPSRPADGNIPAMGLIVWLEDFLVHEPDPELWPRGPKTPAHLPAPAPGSSVFGKGGGPYLSMLLCRLFTSSRWYKTENPGRRARPFRSGPFLFF